MSRAGRSEFYHCNRITLVREPPWILGRGGADRPDIDTTKEGRGRTNSPAARMSWVAFNQVDTRTPNGRTGFNLLGRKWPAAVPT